MSEIVNDRYEDSCGMSLLARDQYEREVSWFETEPLSPSEEQKYLERIWRARRDPSNAHLKMLAKDARVCLTQHYQPLVRAVVRGYGRCGVDFLDLVQEANIGLLRAFDTCPLESCPDKTFRDWAVGCIRVSLKEFSWSKHDFVRLCPRVRKGISDIGLIERRYCLEVGRSPLPSELSAELGLSLDRVYELLHYRHLQGFLSIDAISLETSEDCCDFVALYQQVSDAEMARSEMKTEHIERALSQLSSRQREVIRLRYGLSAEGCHTSDEIGVLLGLERSTVNDTAYFGRKRLRKLLVPLYEEEQVIA